MNEPDLFAWQEARDEAMEAVAANAEEASPGFAEKPSTWQTRNVAAVTASVLRERQEYLRLVKYLIPGTTKQEAVEAYLADNHGRDT